MSNPLAASRKVMKNYLSELLTDGETSEVVSQETKIVEADKLEKLLNKVNVATISAPTSRPNPTKSTPCPAVIDDDEVEGRAVIAMVCLQMVIEGQQASGWNYNLWSE